MTREVQSGQVGAPLVLSCCCIVIVNADGVQTGQPMNCVCLLYCVHVSEWAASVICVLVLVSCYWVI